MSKSAMFQKIVPVAIVALTALSAVGTAAAHELIIPRPGFAEALASIQTASNAQAQPAVKAQVQVRSDVQSASKTSAYNTGASSNDSDWWKDR